jgi:two-component system sensor histidine kinase/response regulator
MYSRFVKVALVLGFLMNSSQLRAQNKEIDSLRGAINKMRDDTGKVNSLRLLFIATIDSLDVNRALPIAQEQLNLAQKIHFEKGQAMAYKLLSVGYETEGNLEKALEASLNSLKIYEKLKDSAGIASGYNNIGLVYQDENETDEALNYFKKSLDIYGKLRNIQENQWRSLMNMGRMYEKQNRDSLALNSYQQSLAVGKDIKTNQNLYIASSLYHIGSISYDRREYDLSGAWLKKALSLIPGAREVYPVAEIYVLLSKICIIKGQPDQGLAYAIKALDVVKRENYESQLAECYLQVSNAYAALSNYPKAYEFEKLHIKLKDSLLSSENIQKIEKLQYNYSLEKKDNLNRELLKDKKLAESEVSLEKAIIQRQYAIGGFIGTALLSFILLSLFYYNGFKTKKKDNELLNVKQQEILQQNEEIIAQSEQILKQKEHLEQANNSKNKLFSIISHDLKSPLATLQAMLLMFDKEYITGEKMVDLSGQLLETVKRTTAMMDNVLYWAISQMDGIRLEKQVFDIRELVISNLGNYNKQAGDKKIVLINKLDKATNVMADPNTIDIVVRNLVSNAIKFCTENDSITISSMIRERFLCLSVRDTGRGMSIETQQRLFDTSDFSSTYGTAKEKGTGLGLNLCKEFVTMNGGSIRVDSVLGQGSSFTFTVPLA